MNNKNKKIYILQYDKLSLNENCQNKLNRTDDMSAINNMCKQAGLEDLFLSSMKIYNQS